MREADVNDTDLIARAAEAAERLFDAEDGSTVDIYEPRNPDEANEAVRRFGQLFKELPGTITRVLEAASGSAKLLSSDRLQGLSEIVQNADDAEASQVRLLLTPTDLLVTHDGRPVRLHHVLGFATPWLSTKGEDAATSGRFGIGLMTLRSLSETMEVHCPPYHVRIGDPTISPIDRPTLPLGFQEDGCTTLRVPLEEGSVSSEEIVEWLDRWDDSALLFLRHVSRVTLVAPGGETVRELTLSRSDDNEIAISGSSVIQSLSTHWAEARDGRSWLVYSAEVRSPAAISRARKATGSKTPVAVALPLSPVQSGEVYAGLPVMPSNSALFVSAQFDPLASRLGFADNEWNRALVHFVAEVWSHAALNLFSQDPKVAWLAIPISAHGEGDTGRSLVESLELAIMNRVRQWLAAHLSFQVPGLGLVSLTKLAVEVRPLEGILAEDETSALAGLPATLPSEVRDGDGRWRKVLEDWRTAGADLPKPVSVERALDLLRDKTRSADSTIALAAVALEENLGDRLIGLPCVITHDGRRIIPPSGDSPDAVTAVPTSLGQQLGVVTLLHSAHLRAEETARGVLAWLGECGALIDGSDDRSVVYRLATAGRSGHPLDAPLTDEQARALRDVFEQMDPDERLEIGADVGRAISLEAYIYEGRRLRTTSAHPVDAYLSRRIDREPDSLAAAAEKTPGLIWLSEKYAEILRSPFGRSGIGAQRFLRLLGAATVPRLGDHPQLERRYVGLPMGLNRQGPEARVQEMRKRGATYTIQDYDSPDLQAVAEDISRERRNRLRRKRAGALLATLSRAWQRSLNEYGEVESAYDYHQWLRKGQIRAYWLWQVGDIAWLDDESGTPRRPVELRVRTPSAIAIYGDDAPDYLHKDLDQESRRTVLMASGVSGDPSRSELVDRLRRLRDTSNEGRDTPLIGSVNGEAAIVYKALAHDLEETISRSVLNTTQLRSEFQQGQGLLLTNHGWLPPRSVLAGPPIFGNYGAFTPPVEGAERLWSALNLRRPSSDDCVKVIQKIARKCSGPDEEEKTILLETLRALALHYQNGNIVQRRRLTKLALWTTKGWVRSRPVYATDDPILLKGLRDQLPLWEPGGGLEQFNPLLGPLRVEEIRTRDSEIINPTLADVDPEATELFQKALDLLKEDLARNDPRLATSIRLPWEEVLGFEVRIHPSLSLRIHAISDGTGKEYVSEVDAKMEVAHRCMFIRWPSVLPRVDGGGRALAALFEGNTRRLAQAWRAACDQAEEGIEADRIELAQQRVERDRAQTEMEISRRTSALRELTAAKGETARSVATTSPRRAQDGSRSSRTADDLGPPRTLVDPGSLRLVDPRGRIEKGKQSTRRQSRREGSLVEPTRISTPPRNRTPIRGYSDNDKEDVGMRLVRMLLSSDRDEIVDLRIQRGVGADAIDSMERFFELKVSAGAEPDGVLLTRSEVQRAMSTDKYFLIVISGVEGVDAKPKARVFVDPLKQLRQTYNGSITLSGVNSVESLVYEFEPGDDAPTSSAHEELM